MGSDFSKQVCCLICERCKEQSVNGANEETSETKPILQTSGAISICCDTQPSTPAMKVSKQGSEEVQSLSQNQHLSADAVENLETCSAIDPIGMTEGWEAAWRSVDSTDGETEDAEVVTQEEDQQARDEMGNVDEKKPVSHASGIQAGADRAQDVKLATDEEQPDQVEAGSGGSPCVGITVRDGEISNIEFSSDAAAGQDCDINPLAEVGRNVLLSAVQRAEETEPYFSPEQTEEMNRAQLAEASPQSTKRAELTFLLETASVLTVQDMQKVTTVEPLEVRSNGMAHKVSISAMPWVPLYPEGKALEPVNQLLDFLKQEKQPNVMTAQEMESLCCVEPAEPSTIFLQSSGGVYELEDDESRVCDAEAAASEAEPQHRIMQQTIEVCEERLPCVQIPVKQEAEFLDVIPSLSEVFGSSGEIEAENGDTSEI